MKNNYTKLIHNTLNYKKIRYFLKISLIYICLIFLVLFSDSTKLKSENIYYLPADYINIDFDRINLDSIYQKVQNDDNLTEFDFLQLMMKIEYHSQKNNKIKTAIKAAYDIILYYYSKDDYDNCLKYYNKYSNFFGQNLKNENYSSLLEIIAYIYNYQANYNESLNLYYKLNSIHSNNADYEKLSNNYTNIGNVYLDQAKYFKSIDMYLKARDFAVKSESKTAEAAAYVNIGIIYSKILFFTEAHRYLAKALELNYKLNNNYNLAVNLLNIGKVYSLENKRDSSMFYLLESLDYANHTNDNILRGGIFFEIGDLYRHKKIYDSSLVYYNKANDLNLSINNRIGIAYCNSGISRVLMATNKFDEEILKMNLQSLQIAQQAHNFDLLFIIYDNLTNYYLKKKNVGKSFEYLKLKEAIKDSIFSLNLIKEAGRLEAKYELEKQVETERNLRLENSKITKTIIIASVISLSLLILFVILILKERRKTEKLLLNIIPKSISNRLKNNSKTVAEKFENASVVFIDIAGFTNICGNFEPEDIVRVLNIIYTRFDKIADKYGLEKIKTIGDCYMAAAGVPVINRNHIVNAAMFAYEAVNIDFGDELKNVVIIPDGSNLNIQFRCGLDCGPLIGGVIGEKKFIYDLWGDTVNIASRMEEHGIVSKIQVTERFRENLIEHINKSNLHNGKVFTFVERGLIEIKGKGKMKTWILDVNEKN